MRQETVEGDINKLRIALAQLTGQQTHMVTYAQTSFGEVAGYLSVEQREKYRSAIEHVEDLFQFLTNNPLIPWGPHIGEIGNNCSLIIEEVKRSNLESSYRQQIQQLTEDGRMKDAEIARLNQLLKNSSSVTAMPKHKEALERLKTLQEELLKGLGSTRLVYDSKVTMERITKEVAGVVLSTIIEKEDIPEDDIVFLKLTRDTRTLIRKEKPDKQLDKVRDRETMDTLSQYGLELGNFINRKTPETY